jgi:hypothetical protein
MNWEYDNEQPQKAYPTQSVGAFPLNTCLRFIPELTNLSTRSKLKVGRLRARQLNVCAAFRSVTTWELQQLDWPDAKLGNQTLRDRIMGIYSHEYPTFSYCGYFLEGAWIWTYLLLSSANGGRS